MIGLKGSVVGTVVRASYQHNAVMLDAEGIPRGEKHERLLEAKFPWEVPIPLMDWRVEVFWRIDYGVNSFVPTVVFERWEKRNGNQGHEGKDTGAGDGERTTEADQG